MHSAPKSVLHFIQCSVSLGGSSTAVYSTLLKLMGSRRLASGLFRDFFKQCLRRDTATLWFDPAAHGLGMEAMGCRGDVWNDVKMAASSYFVSYAFCKAVLNGEELR